MDVYIKAIRPRLGLYCLYFNNFLCKNCHINYKQYGKETIEDYPPEDKEIVEEKYQSSTFTIELVE